MSVKEPTPKKQNPLTRYLQPPQPKQKQSPPGKEEELRPKADHG
jgi:hypothetical protein